MGEVSLSAVTLHRPVLRSLYLGLFHPPADTRVQAGPGVEKDLRCSPQGPPRRSYLGRLWGVLMRDQRGWELC